MQIRRNSWHHQMYVWYKHGNEPYFAKQTRYNLCPYARTVLFKAPLLWLFLAGRIGVIPVPILSWGAIASIIPLTLFLRHHHVAGKATIWGYLISAILIGLIESGRRLKQYKKKKYEKWMVSQLTEYELRDYNCYRDIPVRFRKKKNKSLFWCNFWLSVENWLGAVIDNIVDFCRLIKAFFSAIHHKVCPEIEVVDTATKNSTNSTQ